MKTKTKSLPKILRGLSNVLEFGKHEGSTIEQVMKEDPNWLHWALQNIPDFKLNPTALKALPPYVKRENHFEDWDRYDGFDYW